MKRSGSQNVNEQMKHSRHVKSNCQFPHTSLPHIFPMLDLSFRDSCQPIPVNLTLEFQKRFSPDWLTALSNASHPLFLSKPSEGIAQLFPIPFQPPVFTIWDVRALFKIKLVTTQVYVVLNRQSQESTICLI